METATFAAGCFWGVEAAFRKVPGVLSATSGYIGGTLQNPTYKDVCSGTSGHAEAVQVEFDPAQVSYDELLKVFWSSHNPTTRNRQGPDVGSQYRSAIFVHSEEQKAAAETSRAALNSSSRWSGGVVTEITPAPEFFPAEEYHQRYHEKHGRH